MSSAGVIYDMIRRDKVNREMKQQLRQKRKERRYASNKGASSAVTNISWQELEQINRRLKEKEELDERKSQILMLIVLAGVAAFGVLLFLAIKFIG